MGLGVAALAERDQLGQRRGEALAEVGRRGEALLGDADVHLEPLENRGADDGRVVGLAHAVLEWGAEASRNAAIISVTAACLSLRLAGWTISRLVT